MCWTLESSFYIFDFEGSLETEQLKSFFLNSKERKKHIFYFIQRIFALHIRKHYKRAQKRLRRKKLAERDRSCAAVAHMGTFRDGQQTFYRPIYLFCIPNTVSVLYIFLFRYFPPLFSSLHRTLCLFHLYACLSTKSSLLTLICHTCSDKESFQPILCVLLDKRDRTPAV